MTVVLPASMWAHTPILRIDSNVLAIISFLSDHREIDPAALYTLRRFLLSLWKNHRSASEGRVPILRQIGPVVLSLGLPYFRAASLESRQPIPESVVGIVRRFLPLKDVSPLKRGLAADSTIPVFRRI